MAITYVLLYEDDCGPLGHAVDHESFTVFLEPDPAGREWVTQGVLAVAHRGTSIEQQTRGSGTDIWVSRNKHANFADVHACGVHDLWMDECLEHGPPPSHFTFVNAGEPEAPLVGDLGSAIHARFRGLHAWPVDGRAEPGSLAAHFEDVPPFSIDTSSDNHIAPRNGKPVTGKDRVP